MTFPDSPRLRHLLAPAEWSNRSVTMALAIAALLYVALFGFLVVSKSLILQNSDDYAQYLQPLWATANGEPFRTTWREVGGPGESLLGLHFELTLPLLLPIYLVWSEPESLLIFQVILVALAAFPIAFTAAHLLGKPVHGLMFGLAHLANPFLQRALFYDFHPESIQFFALTWAAACLIQGRLRGFAIAAVFAGLTKEDSWLYVFALGVFAWIFNPPGFAKNRRAATFTIVGAMAALIVTSAILIPAWRGAQAKTFATKFPTLGDDLVEIIFTVLTEPAVVAGLIWDRTNWAVQSRVFLLFLFLPFLSLRGLLLIAPATLIACLTERESIKTLSALYPFSLLFFHPFAAMYGLSNVGRLLATRINPITARTAIAGLVMLASGTAAFTYAPNRLKESDTYQSYFVNRFPLSHGFSWEYFKDNEHARIGRRFMRTVVPPDVPLSTEYRLSAHVANRRDLHAIEDRLEEWVLFDLHGPAYSEPSYVFLDVLQSGEYGVVAFEDGYTLLRRGAPPGQMAQALALAERRVEAESLERRTGQNVADARVPSRFARMGERDVHRPGVLFHQLRRRLAPGKYTAIYAIRFGDMPEGPFTAGRIEVNLADQPRHLARRLLTSENVARGVEYQLIALPFELETRATVEVLIRFTSEVDMWVDHVEIHSQPPSTATARPPAPQRGL